MNNANVTKIAFIAAALVMSVGLIRPASADNMAHMKTNQLLQLCNAPKTFDDQVLCGGYILGVLDTAIYWDQDQKVCMFALPPDADINQVPIRISQMLASAAAGGTQMPSDATLSVIVALRAAYPCPKN